MMTPSSVQKNSYFSCLNCSESRLQSKWFAVALAISSFIFLSAAIFGGMGLFASNLPSWLAHAIGTVGHTGCLTLFIWGTALGSASIISTVILLIRNRSRHDQSHLNISNPRKTSPEPETPTFHQSNREIDSNDIESISSSEASDQHLSQFMTLVLAESANKRERSSEGDSSSDSDIESVSPRERNDSNRHSLLAIIGAFTRLNPYFNDSISIF